MLGAEILIPAKTGGKEAIMKKFYKVLFWFVFCVLLYALVYLGFAVVGEAIGNHELRAIGVAYGILADVLVMNSEKTRRKIEELFER